MDKKIENNTQDILHIKKDELDINTTSNSVVPLHSKINNKIILNKLKKIDNLKLKKIKKESKITENPIINRKKNQIRKQKLHTICIDHNNLNTIQENEDNPNIDENVILFQDLVVDGFNNNIMNNRRTILESLNKSLYDKNKKLNFQSNLMHKSESSYFIEYQKYQKKLLEPSLKKEISIRKESRKNIPLMSNIDNKNLKQVSASEYVLGKKTADDFPLLLNTPFSSDKNYNSFSEKERNEKNILALLKLKHFLETYWKQRKGIIVDFFNKHCVREEIFFNNICLENFANYIMDNINNPRNKDVINIETRIPMLGIITNGIKYKSSIAKIPSNKNIIYKKLPFSYSMDHYVDKKEINDNNMRKTKIKDYRSFLNRNYKTSVINSIVKGLKKDEILNYFSKKKVGLVDIRDKNNLANNLDKQSRNEKIFNSLDQFSKHSINSFNSDDYKELDNELNRANNTVIKKMEIKGSNSAGRKIIGANEKIIDKLNQRLYYTIKEKYHLNHPDVIPKQKKKLLEYIIVQKMKERLNFEEKLLK